MILRFIQSSLSHVTRGATKEIDLRKRTLLQSKRYRMKTLVVFAIFGLTFVLAAQIPSFFTFCKRSDPNFGQCLTETVSKAVQGLGPGLKSLKVVPLEPLAVDSVKIGETEGSVRLRQEYHNIKLYGLTKDFKMLNYSVDFDKCLITGTSHVPQVDFIADYKVNGQILVLPIKGSGKSNITMFDMTTDHKLVCQEYEKDGQTYWKIAKYLVKLHPKRVAMKFENLFSSGGMIGDQLNNFINDNADMLFNELKGSYEESFGLVFAQISNEVFRRFPVDVIFPK